MKTNNRKFHRRRYICRKPDKKQTVRMAKYLRRIAKHNMEKAGIKKINKKIKGDKGDTCSIFSLNWKKYIDQQGQKDKRRRKSR